MEAHDFQQPWKNSDVKFIFDLEDESDAGSQAITARTEASATPSRSLYNPEDPFQAPNLETSMSTEGLNQPSTSQNQPTPFNSQPTSPQSCLYGCKLVLSMWSPVFEAMFEPGHFREGNMEEVHMPRNDLVFFPELLRVTHPPTAEINYENARLLIPLAHRYQMAEILDRCQSAIIQYPYSIELNVLYLHISVAFGLNRLYEHAMHISTTLAPTDILTKHEIYPEMDSGTKCRLLERKLNYLEELIFTRKVQPQKNGSVVRVKNLYRHVPTNKCIEHRDVAHDDHRRQGHLAGIVPKCEACFQVYRDNCLMEFYHMMDTYDENQNEEDMGCIPACHICFPPSEQE